eukprot:augustus_masked-scaffold_7-processed-gene-13.2-mRNA-1 protein AED:0.31 eAED:0.32 QI:0/-1/0/1/-1/1/1/0/527
MKRNLPIEKKKCFVELLEVHKCLRNELSSLCNNCQTLVLRAKELLSHQTSEKVLTAFLVGLNELIKQFDFFFVIFNSHSKAEDDIIMPELDRRCPIENIKRQIEEEHHGHEELFQRAMHYFGPLRTIKPKDIAPIEKLRFLCTYLEDILKELSGLSNKVFLHLRSEEEELLPLLDKSFSVAELNNLFGRVLGERPAEVIEGFLNLISRGLTEEEKENTIAEMLAAAKGTRFSDWLGSVGKNIQNQEPQNLQSMYTQNSSGLQDETITSDFGCKHYRRNCKILSPCCNRLFSCRLCHDEFFEDKPQPHQINRYEIKQMLCLFCNKLQPIGEKCEDCAQRMAIYVCLVCNLFDSSSRKKYHCPFCNVCRIGSNLGDDFFHCMNCNCCLNMRERDHRCQENMLEKDCPICFENLFDSTKAIKRTACGHYLHVKCFDELKKNDYRCAICRKAIVNMQSYWDKFDEAYQEFIRKCRLEGIQNVAYEEHLTICNECEIKKVRRRVNQAMHANLLQFIIPYRCDDCGSYNTKEM